MISCVLCYWKGKDKNQELTFTVGSRGKRQPQKEGFQGNAGGEKKWKGHVRPFATPWTVAHQAPLSMEFSRQEYWSGLPFPSPGYLPNPGIKPGSPMKVWRQFRRKWKNWPSNRKMGRRYEQFHRRRNANDSNLWKDAYGWQKYSTSVKEDHIGMLFSLLRLTE